MALVIQTQEDMGQVEMIRLDRKLWLTAEKDRVVEDGDIEAAFLYGPEGYLVPKDEAKQLGALPKKSERQRRKITGPAEQPETGPTGESENE